ncbi:MAG TPA: hypothetical protein VH249_10355 [Xanthobacteraceae bacterium]|nr:hypothetical protein [Xanthobacteraceae bacterium]
MHRWRPNIKIVLYVTGLVQEGKLSGEAERLKAFALGAATTIIGALLLPGGVIGLERRKFGAFRLALAIAMVMAGRTIPTAEAAGEVYDRAATVAAICRGYASAQHALPYDTMYAQCMYARGYVVPGFSPSPDSPGYQGELPGPGAIGGGH